MHLPGSPWLRRSLLGVILTLIACAALLGTWTMPVSDGIDRQLYDARLRWADAPPASQVIIVDIDERSLVEVGRWPWSRGRMAELADMISTRGQAAVVGFDILFAEAQADVGQDQELADALARTPSALGYYFSSDRGGRANGKLPAPVLESRSVSDLQLTITDWSGYGANLAQLQTSAKAGGFFNPIIDPDGVVRMLPLLGRFGDKVYESFAMSVLRLYLGSPTMILRSDAVELRGEKGVVRIPISEGLGALVPFARLQTARVTASTKTNYGPVGASGTNSPNGVSATGADNSRKAANPATDVHPGSGRFLTISAADVIQNKVDWSLLDGKIVLVGTSAPGLSDLRATPISETSPGVEIHAALIDSALHPAGTPGVPAIHQRPTEAPFVAAMSVAVAGLLMAIGMPAVGAVGVLLMGLGGLLGLIGWNSFAWWKLGWELPCATGLVLTVMLTGLNLALGYFFEGRARRAVANLFGEYVSPELVDRMTRNPGRFARMSSENRELSIMFTDIRGFTRIAESMEPADLREYINEFLTAMTEVIHKHNGTVDKYIGDAVMAFWGAPMEDPAHADQAVSAAQDMLLEVERLNRVNARRGWPTLVIGVGINTGVARVGDMGSKLRRAYTVLGDAVNLASRIESLTKQFGSPIIVGETTARQAQNHVFSELAQVSIAGRNEQVRIYVPIDDAAHGASEFVRDTQPFSATMMPKAALSLAARRDSKSMTSAVANEVPRSRV